MIVYTIYITSFTLFVFLYHYETIKYHMLKIFNNKNTMEQISIGLFTGSLVAVLSSTDTVHAVAYGILTIISLVGIINSNS